MMIRGYQIGARLIAIAAAVFVLVVAAGLFLRSCQSGKVAKKQAEVAEGQAGAAIDSGSEAMNTVSNVAASDAATDALVGMGQAEIAAASQGTKGKAAKKAACRLKAYRDTPQCKEPVQ
jgi:hypothetical protein